MSSESEPKLEAMPEVWQSNIESVGSSAAAQNAICQTTVELGVTRYADSLKAIVLTGSLARQEGTFFRDVSSLSLSGDAEFLLVFRENAPLPLAENLLDLQKAVESKLLEHSLKCRISLASVHPSYLRQLRPHIFAFELFTHGCVLWGDPVISLIPAFPAAAIPLEDAWRLLCNRMIELLEACMLLTDKARDLPQEVFYQTVKLYIDMGTSFLIFTGGYESTYASRAERMRLLKLERGAADTCPIDLAQFAERIMACTQYKLSGNRELHLMGRSCEHDNLAFWKAAVADARSLWRWELAKLTGIEEDFSDQELMRRWMVQQPTEERIRGWLFVLRREGWHRSWRKWPGWIRRGLRASPRYCVYAAASELFFQLSTLVSAPSVKTAQAEAPSKLFGWLPLIRGSMPELENNWRQRASEIAWNYHQFLEGTRS
jgi:hypothetical protein